MQTECENCQKHVNEVGKLERKDGEYLCKLCKVKLGHVKNPRRREKIQEIYRNKNA